MTPFPPVKGKDVVIAFNGNLTSVIEAGGEYKLVVKWSGMDLMKKNGDFCSLSKEFQCPHPAGPVNITKKINLPIIAPSGLYSISVTAQSKNKQRILCASLDLVLNAPSPKETGESYETVATMTEEMKALFSTGVNGLHGVEMVHAINTDTTKHTDWVAARSPFFDVHSVETVSSMLSSIEDIPEVALARSAKKLQHHAHERRYHDLHPRAGSSPSSDTLVAAPVDDNFDLRKVWPACMAPVGESGRCASGWALAAATSFAERRCIAARKRGDTSASYRPYSALDVLLNSNLSKGCNGGSLYQATRMLVTPGVVDNDCMPFGSWETPSGPISKCPFDQFPCMTTGKTPQMSNTTCLNGKSYPDAKARATSVDLVVRERFQDIDEIVVPAIKAGGTVLVSFNVYEDFLYYSSGIYSYSKGNVVGQHAGRIIGYGTENGKRYWLVQNTWSTRWGEEGTFRIARGRDEVKIESDMYIINF